MLVFTVIEFKISPAVSTASKWQCRSRSRGRGIGREAPDSPTSNKPLQVVISTRIRSKA